MPKDKLKSPTQKTIENLAAKNTKASESGRQKHGSPEIGKHIRQKGWMALAASEYGVSQKRIRETLEKLKKKSHPSPTKTLKTKPK